MKKVLKIIGRIILALVIVIALALGVLTIAEYRPAARETIIADHPAEAVLKTEEPGIITADQFDNFNRSTRILKNKLSVTVLFNTNRNTSSVIRVLRSTHRIRRTNCSRIGNDNLVTRGKTGGIGNQHPAVLRLLVSGTRHIDLEF